MKKAVMFLISLFMINLISAYSYGYGDGALSEFLNAIDASTMILGFVFILSFFFIYTGLSRRKVGRQNRAGAGIIAFMVALFITWGVNKSGFDFEGLFFDLGISADFLYAVLPLVLLGLIIFLGIKFNFRVVLIVLGSLLILSGFTDLFYQEGTIIFIGIVLLVAGLIWHMKRKGIKLRRSRNNPRNRDDRRQGEAMEHHIGRISGG